MVKYSDESHGRIREKSPQLNKQKMLDAWWTNIVKNY